MTVNFLQACDASAAVLIDGTSFFAAATDEDGVLRVYDANNPGPPVSSTDVTAFLEPDDPAETEADIEGAAQIGERIYWIGSHGRSRKGKERKIRQRLFATTVSRSGNTIRLQTTGTPCKSILASLIAAPDLAAFDLAKAAAKKPEEEGGLNVEGLAPTPEGHLLIGFRNPIRRGAALVVRLRNPAALVDGGAAPDLVFAGALDLGGRGIRALEFVPSLGIYLVLAGLFADGDDFRLYKWSGEPTANPQQLSVEFGGLHPEELIVTSCSGNTLDVRLFSDDGTDACKQAEVNARRFRSVTAQVDVQAESASTEAGEVSAC